MCKIALSAEIRPENRWTKFELEGCVERVNHLSDVFLYLFGAIIRISSKITRPNFRGSKTATSTIVAPCMHHRPTYASLHAQRCRWAATDRQLRDAMGRPLSGNRSPLPSPHLDPAQLDTWPGQWWWRRAPATRYRFACVRPVAHAHRTSDTACAAYRAYPLVEGGGASGCPGSGSTRRLFRAGSTARTTFGIPCVVDEFVRNPIIRPLAATRGVAREAPSRASSTCAVWDYAPTPVSVRMCRVRRRPSWHSACDACTRQYSGEHLPFHRRATGRSACGGAQCAYKGFLYIAALWTLADGDTSTTHYKVFLRSPTANIFSAHAFNAPVKFDVSSPTAHQTGVLNGVRLKGYSGSGITVTKVMDILRNKVRESQVNFIRGNTAPEQPTLEAVDVLYAVRQYFSSALLHSAWMASSPSQESLYTVSTVPSTVWGPGTVAGRAILALGEATLKGLDRIVDLEARAMQKRLATIRRNLPILTADMYNDLIDLSLAGKYPQSAEAAVQIIHREFINGLLYKFPMQLALDFLSILVQVRPWTAAACFAAIDHLSLTPHFRKPFLDLQEHPILRIHAEERANIPLLCRTPLSKLQLTFSGDHKHRWNNWTQLESAGGPPAEDRLLDLKAVLLNPSSEDWPWNLDFWAPNVPT
ncbi:hypothetical protein B0H16DRAFT_1902476 [Mycena metata]|uniref:Uncharacterized protein n=1 Tax=Mycena metata TaxID=1033252 RepID=A0AAD7GMW4_9AGAR|nr:hypothetical protein B0H16DRAFT_1902476 [Mycena metata]